MSFVVIASKDVLNNGEMKSIKLNGHEFLLARIEDNFFCTDNRCPHMGGDLSLGKLERTVVTCPRHHSQFDISDGHIIHWTDFSGIKLSLGKILKSPRPLKTYSVKVEGEKILVDI